MRLVDDTHQSDACRSLSIEGHGVSMELIERVRAGNWNPENHDADRQSRDALAARGYWQAFQVVRANLGEIITGTKPARLIRTSHREWHRELSQPCITAGLIPAAALASYRNNAVFLRTPGYVPPRWDGNQIGAPNYFPDILSKLAYDKKLDKGRFFHVEAVAFLTGVHVTVKPPGQKSFEMHRAVGGGGSIAGNYEFSPQFRILANAFWSDGGAHYLVGTGPQVVIRPTAAGIDVTPSLVHAGAGSAGFEWHASQKTALAAYYGVDYFGRNFFLDTTNAANRQTIIGYGGPGSPNTNNRAIQQATFDWIQTFWKDPTFGALQFYTQYSYLTRAPWFVAPGLRKSSDSSPGHQTAHTHGSYPGCSGRFSRRKPSRRAG
jgi:hypothetical protein